jgi:hypothetical protein
MDLLTMIAPQAIRDSLTKLTQETQQQTVIHALVILASLSWSAKVVIHIHSVGWVSSKLLLLTYGGLIVVKMGDNMSVLVVLVLCHKDNLCKMFT